MYVVNNKLVFLFFTLKNRVENNNQFEIKGPKNIQILLSKMNPEKVVRIFCDDSLVMIYCDFFPKGYSDNLILVRHVNSYIAIDRAGQYSLFTCIR